MIRLQLLDLRPAGLNAVENFDFFVEVFELEEKRGLVVRSPLFIGLDRFDFENGLSPGEGGIFTAVLKRRIIKVLVEKPARPNQIVVDIEPWVVQLELLRLLGVIASGVVPGMAVLVAHLGFEREPPELLEALLEHF